MASGNSRSASDLDQGLLTYLFRGLMLVGIFITFQKKGKNFRHPNKNFRQKFPEKLKKKLDFFFLDTDFEAEK